MIERFETNRRYAQMVVDDTHVWIAGQIADDYDLDVTGQAIQVLSKIDRLLAVASIDKSRIVNATVWIAQFSDYAAYNAVWEKWIPADCVPARASVGATLLDDRLRIEIAIVAKR